MKAKLITVWEQDATRWPRDRRTAIRFAKILKDEENPKNSKVLCVHPKGTVFESPLAEALISAGLAVEVTE
jgi:hypothetical protein